MFQRVRRHINPSTAIAIVALVFAATGGAFAATGGGTSGGPHATLMATTAKAKAKTKTKAGPRGPAGPKGATGATGAAGATGLAGSAGAKGETGANGTPGSPGTPGDKGEPGNTGSPGSAGSPGNSPVGHEFTGSRVGSTCTSGGVEFAIASGTTTYACNGAEGPKGPEGSPWTDGGTLPAGKTETGTWSFSYHAAGAGEELHTPISFSIPLAPEVVGEPKAVHAEFGPSANCAGSLLVPSAKPDYLCVYTSAETNVKNGEIQDLEAGGAAATFGAVIYEETVAAGEAEGFGSWAVTAP
jgi:hypothetical protein